MPFISRERFNAIVTHCMLPIEIALQRTMNNDDIDEAIESVAHGEGTWQQETALSGKVDQPWKRFEGIYREYDWDKVHDFRKYLKIGEQNREVGVVYEPRFREMKRALEIGVDTYIYDNVAEVREAARTAGFPDHNLEDMTDLCEQIIDTVRWIHNNIIREQEA